LIIIFLVAAILSGLAWSYWKKIRCRVEISVETFAIREERTASGTPIDINAASLDELAGLKRIGKTLAQRIIDYRSSQGPFRSKEEIKNVKGIGDKLYEDIKDSIAVE
jgi:competence protein ComEA